MYNHLFDDGWEFKEFFKKNDSEENRKAVLQTDKLKFMYCICFGMDNDVMPSIESDEWYALVLVTMRKKISKRKLLRLARKRFKKTEKLTWRLCLKYLANIHLRGNDIINGYKIASKAISFYDPYCGIRIDEFME